MQPALLSVHVWLRALAGMNESGGVKAANTTECSCLDEGLYSWDIYLNLQ